ncbi:hypothetical protein Z043_124344 [Scleropages formosus]|uniref:Septin-type G domain-containing protein n=1 Tax=Scleropages formosus TaxID=113540 RepID=A0A0P7TJZ9_SCLFO|nr:hypothetical protein Z043_124344 [Scleropages formosus]
MSGNHSHVVVMQAEGARSIPLSGHVGFDSMPDQLVNKSVSHGFCFNILCVGETGVGKSTLMDTLFNTKFEGEPTQHNQPGVQLRSRSYELQESNVRLKLTVVDTVGFGDQINKEDSYKPIVEFIDAQFEAYLQEELKIKRTLHSYHDTRIHACLYFISPTGHSLKSLDLVTMKKLDSKVNIIPIVAKSDAISKSELAKFKIKITSELVSNGVQIYQFPTDDETVAEINSTMNVSSSQKRQAAVKARPLAANHLRPAFRCLEAGNGTTEGPVSDGAECGKELALASGLGCPVGLIFGSTDTLQHRRAAKQADLGALSQQFAYVETHVDPTGFGSLSEHPFAPLSLLGRTSHSAVRYSVCFGGSE